MAYIQLESGTVLETDNPANWPEAKRLTAAKGKELLKAEALEQLHEYLKPGDKVHCLLRHVAASGMSRRIDFYKIEDNKPIFLTGYIGRVLDYRHHKDGGLVVRGCGMDMGFAIVYEMGRVLFPNGFIPADAGASHGRNGKPATETDRDGGYALTSHWL